MSRGKRNNSRKQSKGGEEMRLKGTEELQQARKQISRGNKEQECFCGCRSEDGEKG